METKDLQREVHDAERLGERTRMVLQLLEQLQASKSEGTTKDAEIATLKQQIVAKDTEIATLKQPSQEAEHE